MSDRVMPSRQLWSKRVLATIIISGLCITYGTVYSLYFDNNSIRSSETTIMKELLYNDLYTGYNSTVSGNIELPIGIMDNLEFPSLENLTLSVYSYNCVNIKSKEYINETIHRFFSEIDIENMTQTVKTYEQFDSDYLELSNKDCWIHLLASGGIRFHSNVRLLGKADNINGTKNAIDLAYDFLKEHGGLPSDISHLDSWGVPMFAYIDDGSRINGSYTVRFSRNITNYTIYGSALCNDIRLTFDSETKELYEMRWHWPTLKSEFIIEAPSTVEDILDHYKMNSNEAIKWNITEIQIQYWIPPSIVSGQYDTHSDVYYLAPYLRILLENGHYYFLSIRIE